MEAYRGLQVESGTSGGRAGLHRLSVMLLVSLVVMCLISLSTQAAHAATTTEASLTVTQEFTYPTFSAPDNTFNYILEAKAPGNPMPAGSIGGPPTHPGGLPAFQITLSGSVSAGVGPIEFTAPGTYKYEVRMANTPAKSGYVYDMQVYTVTVYVVSSASGIVADTVITNGSGEKVVDIEFDQNYAPSPAIVVDPPVKKQIQGSTPATNATFTFKLEAADKSSPMPPGSSNGVKYMDIVGVGEKDFGAWSYTRAGTYYYTVSEVNRGDWGYEYDIEVYTITDRVTDVNGQLVNSRTVTNASNKQVGAFLFINTYRSASPAAALTGPKTGDNMDTGLYTTLLALGLVATVSSALWLVHDKKRQGSLVG